MPTMFATALPPAILAAVALGLPAAAAEPPAEPPAAVRAATPADAPAAVGTAAPPPRFTTTSVRLQPTTVDAMTYRPDLAPPGAEVRVTGVQAATGTTVLLSVHGLVPHRGYGAHVHVQGCGPTPTDAGPHYQHRPDPNQPSTDPVYANPRNEIWLDLSTDAHGNGTALARVSWAFPDQRPRSVVLHETHTHTGPGVAGTAGARLACVTVDL